MRNKIQQHPDDQNDVFEDDMDPPRRIRGAANLLRELLGRWYWVALGLILGVTGSLYYLSKAPSIYATSATLLVKQQTYGVLTKDKPEELDMRSADAMNTVAERLKRRSLMDKVAARDDVQALEGLIPERVNWLPAWLAVWTGGETVAAGPIAEVERDPARLAGLIGSWMSVNIRRGTRLLDITFQHPVPEVAKVLADAVADEYILEISSNRSTGRMTSIELLTSKSDEARLALQGAQNAHASYLRALESYSELEAKEKEQAELARRYLPKHPKMITCVGQLESLQARFLRDFQAAVDSGADSEYWRQTGVRWDPESQTLDQRLDFARRTLLARTAVLKSEIQSQELVFNSILTRIGETDVNQAATESEVEISSHALLPGWPVSPVRNKVLLTGLAGGACFGLLLAFVATRLDRKIHHVGEVEDLTGLQVLGAFPELSGKILKRLVADGKSQENDSHAAWDPMILFRPALANTTFAEMVRVMQTSIALLGQDDESKVILFTSALPGEGKTFCATNFAMASAGQHKRVLLMDLDLRKPAAHKALGLRVDGVLGARGFLSGEVSLEQAVQPVPGALNLDVMVAGRKADGSNIIALNRTILQKAFHEACAAYDMVVVDTPPLLLVSDARTIARFADRVCLVARAEHTSKQALQRAVRLLDDSGSAASGVIVNGYRTRRLSSFGYKGYSYSYYGGAAGKYGYGRYGSYGAYGDAER